MDSYKLYSRISDHETVLELWGASTKHPDSVFYYSDFKKSEWVDKRYQIPQWIWECASKLNWPMHVYGLTLFGIEIYEGWMNN
jgi:hypothetical protein